MSDLTKRAIAESFKKLLSSRVLSKITVRDITDECGVNRQTFYYHFKDVYDLMEWIFTDETEKAMEENNASQDWRAGILALYSRMIKNRPLILNAFRSVSRDDLERYISSMARREISELVRQRAEGKDISHDNLEFITDMYVYGLLGILLEWISNGMDEKYSDQINRFFALVSGSLEQSIRNLQNS